MELDNTRLIDMQCEAMERGPKSKILFLPDESKVPAVYIGVTRFVNKKDNNLELYHEFAVRKTTDEKEVLMLAPEEVITDGRQVVLMGFVNSKRYTGEALSSIEESLLSLGWEL